MAAWPHDRDRAAARGALASGVAIGGPPFLLAALADAFGLRAASLIVPGLLIALVLLTAGSMRTRTRHPPELIDTTHVVRRSYFGRHGDDVGTLDARVEFAQC